MNVERLTGELERVLDGVRAELNREIAGVRKASEELRVERATAQTALAQIEDQHKQAQANLAMVLADVDRYSVHVGVGSNIAAAKAELEKLRAETEKASTTLAGLRKQQSDEQHKLTVLQNETSRLGTLRNEHETAIGAVRALVKSFG